MFIKDQINKLEKSRLAEEARLVKAAKERSAKAAEKKRKQFEKLKKEFEPWTTIK